MKVAVGVLTYFRPWLLRQTIDSLLDSYEMYTLCVLDNSNGTDSAACKILEQAPITSRIERDGLPVGQAMNELAEVCLSFKPELVVLTADDYKYAHWWLEKLLSWWAEAPDDIAITSCHMENEYPWNTVTECIEYHGGKALIRKTLPGSNWTFRASMWDKIGPIPEQTGGEDSQVCKKLTAAGYRLAAVELAEHIGEEQSAWGNMSYKRAAPLDRQKWGLDELHISS